MRTNQISQIEPYFGKQEAKALASYIADGGWGTEHVKSREFEEGLAKFLGVKHCSVTVNGTQALIFALMAVGIKEGDKVLVPSLTMIATINAVRFLGAIPVFCDVDSLACMDWDDEVPKNIKAVIYVSLNGRASLLSDIVRDCWYSGIPLIEDACQSFGSKYHGEYLGTFGDIGCFSLSPHKIISTGQGGFIATNRTDLYDKFRSLKDFGRLSGGIDIHPEFGVNGKFTDFQAVIGIEQLKRIDKLIAKKKIIFETYKSYLEDSFEFIETSWEVTPWFVDIYMDNPKRMKDHLISYGIQTRLMYPPCHSQPCYGEELSLPMTEYYSGRGLWLPSSPSLKEKEIKEICKTILGA